MRSLLPHLILQIDLLLTLVDTSATSGTVEVEISRARESRIKKADAFSPKKSN